MIKMTLIGLFAIAVTTGLLAWGEWAEKRDRRKR